LFGAPDAILICLTHHRQIGKQKQKRTFNGYDGWQGYSGGPAKVGWNNDYKPPTQGSKPRQTDRPTYAHTPTKWQEQPHNILVF